VQVVEYDHLRGIRCQSAQKSTGGVDHTLVEGVALEPHDGFRAFFTLHGQQRLNGGYGYNGYGYNNGFAAGARVLGISRVEPRSNGELMVRGVANSGRYAYGYNGQGQVDLTWKCKVDYRGFIRDIDINRAQTNYGYGTYSPYTNDYSEYGYRRY
jgi:hypothetical protein